MAQDKKSFLLYCDLIHTVEQLTDEQAGNLFKHILSYVNDKDPQTDNVITRIAFEPVKQSLKRDLQKYESIRQRNSDNARKRWDASVSKTMRPHTTASECIPNDTRNADSVNVNDIKVNKGVFKKPNIQQLKEYMTEIGMNDVAERWLDYYDGNGWKVGKNAMKDWKAVVRTWRSNNQTQAPRQIEWANIKDYE